VTARRMGMPLAHPTLSGERSQRATR
jgi:hypothetical protein